MNANDIAEGMWYQLEILNWTPKRIGIAQRQATPDSATFERALRHLGRKGVPPAQVDKIRLAYRGR